MQCNAMQLRFGSVRRQSPHTAPVSVMYYSTVHALLPGGGMAFRRLLTISLRAAWTKSVNININVRVVCNGPRGSGFGGSQKSEDAFHVLVPTVMMTRLLSPGRKIVYCSESRVRYAKLVIVSPVCVDVYRRGCSWRQAET